MRYTYAYKTSDGTRHEALMEARCREDVFSELRKRGIKAIKVVAADGSKANGEVRGVRKRVVAAIVLGVAVLAGGIAFFLGESNNRTAEQSDNSLSSPRHQIYGDPVLVEAFERGDFGRALTNRVDQMLAWFAQPGKLMCPRGTDPRRCADEFAKAVEGGTNPATGGTPVAPEREASPDGQDARRPRDTTREVRELRQIVNGMREEMAAYLANGNGTPRSFWRRLLERTQQEMQIYERTRRELENEKSPEVWEQKNNDLRKIGLRTIANRQGLDEDD